MKKKQKTTVILAESLLQRHFGKQKLHELVTASRTFPITARVDLQSALEKLFTEHPGSQLIGCHSQFTHETMTVAHLLSNPHYPVVVAPLQHEEIDIGDALPARCLKQALWLAQSDGIRFALLLSSATNFGHQQGMHLEVALPPGESGAQLSRRLLETIETLVRETKSYRGKVLSLEATDRYSGHSGVFKVHKLRGVRREDVILPAHTIRLLDRNIGDFIKQRTELKKLGMPIKKGLLFYGPLGPERPTPSTISRASFKTIQLC